VYFANGQTDRTLVPLSTWYIRSLRTVHTWLYKSMFLPFIVASFIILCCFHTTYCNLRKMLNLKDVFNKVCRYLPSRFFCLMLDCDLSAFLFSNPSPPLLPLASSSSLNNSYLTSPNSEIVPDYTIESVPAPPLVVSIDDDDRRQETNYATSSSSSASGCPTQVGNGGALALRRFPSDLIETSVDPEPKSTKELPTSAASLAAMSPTTNTTTKTTTGFHGKTSVREWKNRFCTDPKRDPAR
jgi:hypothetical protein